MATSGYCEVYVEVYHLSDMSSSGDVSFYMEVTLQEVPQKYLPGGLVGDEKIKVLFTDGRAAVNLLIGAKVTIKVIPTGFEESFTVPDSASYDLSNLISSS